MRKGEHTRRRIQAAAAPLFNQHGFEGATLAALMAATGLRKGGIYRHFAGKEELAVAAFDYTVAEAFRSRMTAKDPAVAGVARLRELIANFVERRSPVLGGCPILNTAVDADDGNPALRVRVRAALRVWMAELESVAAAAVERGELGKGTDPKAVATVIVAALEGALMISRIEGTNAALRRVQLHLDHYLVREASNFAGGMIMPEGKHLRGVGPKEQREYEHIKESAERSGRYGKRAKEVAARTVLKQHKQKGHPKGK